MPLKFYDIPRFISIVFVLTAVLHAEVEMDIGVDRTTAYQGESLEYQVVLTDTKPIDDSISPDLSAFTDFEIQSLPKQTFKSSSSSVRVTINGREIRNETESEKYTVGFPYRLTPKKTGVLTVPGPKVHVGGKLLKPRSIEIARRPALNASPDGSVSITVRAPDKQDDVFMEIRVDRTRLYPLQSLTVTLAVQIRELPGELSSNDPMGVQAEPPRLTIPWASDSTLPKGLTPQRNLEDWLNGLLASRRTRGFSINGYASRGFGFDDDFFSAFSGRDPFDAGMLQRTLFQFLPKPEIIQRPDSEGRETTYWEYRFRRTFVPTELGPCSFGPATLKGPIAVADSSSRQGVNLRQTFVVAPAISVDVVDVPEEDRPESYIGAFGTFTWTGDVQPRKAKVGEPITITLRLTGRGSTANVQAPDLARYPEIAENFKTYYPPVEETKGDSCTFTYSARPLKAGTIEFPSIPVAFFDVEKEEFTTLRTEPVSLEIGESKTLPGFSARSAKPAFSGELQRSEQGLFGNMTSPGGAVNQSVDYGRWLTTIVILIATYCVFASIVAGWRVWTADPRRSRRAGAFGRAMRRLAEIERNSDTLSSSILDRCNALQDVLFGYVADRTDAVEQGMTTKDACWKLLESGVEEQTVARVRGILEMLDAARYGGFDLRSLDEIHHDIETILRQLRTFASKF